MTTNLATKYKKLDARDHVLTRPGMYIGSIEPDVCDTWVYDGERMIKKTLNYVPGLYKIFDEILVNAIDHSFRLKKEKNEGKDVNLVKNIKVSIDRETGVIEVMNDGDGIEIALHPEHKIYIPELIFGNMLTSTNYDDTEEKTIGGTNGVGSKVSNIFSVWFEVETVDHVRKLHYKQLFEKNMYVVGTPSIAKYSKKPYTTIRFLPDYEKFKMSSGLTDDMYQVMIKRVYDACAVTDGDVNIFLNDIKLDFKNFEKYVDLYIGAKSEHDRVYEKINDRWEIVASYNSFAGFDQVSFVNGLWTIRGGKHVDYICNQITKNLVEMISKKHKNVTIKPQSIRENLILFVKCTIVNPTFDSQSKETLTTPATKFGSKGELSVKFIEKLYKTGLVDKVLAISQIQDVKTLQKTDGKKRSIIRGIPKLEDANWAGTSKSKECVLILTEGDSAASMAIGGLGEVGRDRYGVFPLKGKVINVQDTNTKKIAENEELINLKKIIGLESGKEYLSIEDLRYGSVMIMTDQDTDGSHIKGLLFNVFYTLWPSLMKTDGFLTSLLTPIVKVRKGNESVSFYSLTEYENWKTSLMESKSWHIKYYKGLGTSDRHEAKEYFREMKKVKYVWNEDLSKDSIDLAFNKKKADDRKEWLATYDRQKILDYTKHDVTFDEFVHRDLIHFSKYDLERSIPNMVDGLKVSQRKIMYCCFKKNLTEKEMKVAQLAAFVSMETAYHHGEASLQSTIVGMAQTFVGSNNIHLLQPNGQFGSRRHGGKDAGQPRYIYTLLSPICQKLFIKDDENVLTYLNDDGVDVEPEFYVPIIPTILVNGALGIGTGFSTNIPCFNPRDIIAVLRRLLDDENIMDEMELVPWYQGFIGTIQKVNGKYVSRGLYHKVSSTKVEITELPVGTWTFDFKCHLEELIDKTPDIKSYENNSTDETVKFTVQFANAATLDTWLAVESNGMTKIENDLKLSSSKPLATTNMYAFNVNGAIQKYGSAIDIIREFYGVRLDYYVKRKSYLLGKLRYDLDILENKIRFIRSVVNGEIVIQTLRKKELEDLLQERAFMKHEGCFDYLTRIPVYNLTIDKVEEFEQDVIKANDKYELVKSTDVKDMWRRELDELEKTLQVPQGKKKLIRKTT
jgi:DNA topoisomerase-2